MTEKPKDLVKRMVFSRENIKKQQDESQEAYNKRVAEARKVFGLVAKTPSGKKLLRYIFVLCGGEVKSIRRDKDGRVDVNETLVTQGARGVWEEIRLNLTSDTIENIERHNWE